MNTDFTPLNVELWIVNWKRIKWLNKTIRSWLESFDFERVNVISNHSSVTEEVIDVDLLPKVKIYRNCLRNDNALGPTSRNYNESYVNTFLSGKKYCICSHDNMLITTGWDKLIKNTNYDLYFAPQGDQVHVMSLNGLKTFGWWDERYSSNGHHELDYISRALNKCLKHNAKASLVDIHWWENNPMYTKGNHLNYHNVGLSDYWKRMNTNEVPQSGAKGQSFDFSTSKWQRKKWYNSVDPFHQQSKYQTTCFGVENGPAEEELDWYSWLNLDNLTVASVDIK